MIRTSVHDGKLTLMKSCKDCDEWKPCSDGPESGFHVNNRGRTLTFSPYCKPCFRKRRAADERRRRAASPEKHRKAVARWTARKRREDGAYFRDAARMAYRLRAARAGREVRDMRSCPATQDRMPVGPFREWLEAYRKRTGLGMEELAFDLGVQERRLWGVLNGAPSVTLSIIDTALTNARFPVTIGNCTIHTLEDLYPS